MEKGGKFLNEIKQHRVRKVNGQIITELIGHNKLTQTQKLIGLILYMYNGNIPAIKISNTYLMNTLNVDNTTITRAMQALENEGYIHREMKKNSYNNQKHRVIHLLKNSDDDCVKSD